MNEYVHMYPAMDPSQSYQRCHWKSPISSLVPAPPSEFTGAGTRGGISTDCQHALRTLETLGGMHPPQY